MVENSALNLKGKEAGDRSQPRGVPIAQASVREDFMQRAGPFGIRVNCVAPGLVYPTQGSAQTRESFRESLMAATPLRRLASPEDVAGPVLFLASDLSRFMTGQVLLVDGGLVMR